MFQSSPTAEGGRDAPKLRQFPLSSRRSRAFPPGGGLFGGESSIAPHYRQRTSQPRQIAGGSRRLEHEGVSDVVAWLSPRHEGVLAVRLAQPVDADAVFLLVDRPFQVVLQQLRLLGRKYALEDRLLDTLAVGFADLRDTPQTSPPR